MITITIYGLDQFTVGHYSREHTANLAQLFETKGENISFYSPNAYVFHNGVEQTSWNAIVKVNAPEKFEVLEEKVAKYLMETLKEFSINLSVEFYYYHSHHRYEHINKEYPRFITDDNLVNVEESDEDELYEGNVFEGMEEKLEAAYAEKEAHECNCHGDYCDCDDDCECECEDEECECGEHECHCGHHHNN
ncbi:MAG: hypothetical protein MJ222_01790 [Bacilli bacterium]|nr:hypothetical protein [Bacilli bacterium]